jgi:biopolymer transport protein ExbD
LTGIASAVTLPVTPMLDMTFQLLFFLVLTLRVDAEPEGKFELESVPDGCNRPWATLEQPIDGFPPLFTIAVRAWPDGSGGISSLVVQSTEGERVLANPASLQVWLSGRRAESVKPGGVRIRADQRLKYAAVIEVMDACRRAGFQEIGFAAPDP